MIYFNLLYRSLGMLSCSSWKNLARVVGLRDRKPSRKRRSMERKASALIDWPCVYEMRAEGCVKQEGMGEEQGDV